MREALRKVAFGPGSLLMVLMILGSLGEVVQQWEATGTPPDGATWRTLILGVLFMAFRSAQAMVAEWAAARGVTLPPPDGDGQVDEAGRSAGSGV